MLISAILPSLGEATLERAVQALRAQTCLLQEIHHIEGIRPFSRAFNHGVSKVRTPFFLQCDADRILHPEAVERLAQGMADDVCMVVGWLQDPLQGPIQGVKLHRTEVARQNPHREECSCETAYLERVFRQGWRMELYSPSDCLGEHLPTHEETYTFARFLYLGRKIRLRRDSSDVRMRLERLADRWDIEVAPTAAWRRGIGPRGVGSGSGVRRRVESTHQQPFRNGPWRDSRRPIQSRLRARPSRSSPAEIRGERREPVSRNQPPNDWRSRI